MITNKLSFQLICGIIITNMEILMAKEEKKDVGVKTEKKEPQYLRDGGVAGKTKKSKKSMKKSPKFM